jgi:hypothetical protein
VVSNCSVRASWRTWLASAPGGPSGWGEPGTCPARPLGSCPAVRTTEFPWPSSLSSAPAYTPVPTCGGLPGPSWSLTKWAVTLSACSQGHARLPRRLRRRRAGRARPPLSASLGHLKEPGGIHEPCGPGERWPVLADHCSGAAAGGVHLGGDPGAPRACPAGCWPSSGHPHRPRTTDTGRARSSAVSPAAAAGPSGDTGYVPTHGTRSGPPWGPAAKPPGLDW